MLDIPKARLSLAAGPHSRWKRVVAEGLEALGVSCASLEDVIITHMHYDHAGNTGLFEGARFHLQDAEMQFVTGRCMCHPLINMAFEADDVARMVYRVFAGRVQFHDGTSEIAPGVTVHRIGGHTKGLQAVRVATERGWVVLASDASHLYAHMEQGRAFRIVYDLGELLEGYRTLRRLASSPRHVVPGHDPLVLERYPAASHTTAGWIARLDLERGALTNASRRASAALKRVQDAGAPALVVQAHFVQALIAEVGGAEVAMAAIRQVESLQIR